MLKRLRSLSPEERRDLPGAVWRLLVVRVCLAGLGIRRTRKLLSGGSKLDEARTLPDLSPWNRRARALRRVASRIPGTHCLARSLALQWWMHRARIPARMEIGVRSVNGAVECHAWLEINGAPIDEEPGRVATYTRLNWEKVTNRAAMGEVRWKG